MALRQGVLGLGAAAATAVGAQALKAKGAAATGWLSAGSTKMVAVLAALALGGGGFAVFRAAGKHAQGRVTPSGALRERAAPNGISAEAPALPAVLESPTQTLPTERAKGARKLARPSIGLSSSGAVEDEVPLLERANRALASAPTQALALTNDHARRFPDSAMDQERELIAITALVRLNRQDQAQARAERFTRQHPGSVYRRQIEAVIAPQQQ